MRILIIPSPTLPWPPVKGGAVQNLIRIYADWNENSDNGKDIEIVSIYNKDAERKAFHYQKTQVHYIKIPYSLLALRDSFSGKPARIVSRLVGLFYMRGIRKRLSGSQSYDAIVFENTPWCVDKVKKSVKNSRIIIHLHNDYLNSDTKSGREILNQADLVLTVSDYLKRRVWTIEKTPKVITLYNGIELDKIQNTEKRIRQDMRKKYGIDEKAIVFIFSSRMVEDKGIKELLEAFTALQTEQNTKLFVLDGKFGRKPSTDPFFKELKKIAQKREKDIVFTGYVPYENIPSYLLMADIGCLPSKWEDPFPLAVIEYLAAGLATIVTNSGGMVEMVEDCGVIVNKEHHLVENLTKAMTELAENPRLRAEYSQKAKKRAGRYTAEIYCRALDVYLEGKSR